MSLAQHLGWTLVHSVWEIALISIVLLIATALLRRADARIRYVLAFAALSGCLIVPIATYAVSIPPSVSPMSTPMDSAKSPVKVTQFLSPTPIVDAKPEPESIERRLEPFLPILDICWLVGLALMCLRLGWGLLAIERIKRKAQIEPVQDWLRTLHSLGSAMRIRRLPDLKLSFQVDSPAVVGAIKAVILFPAAAAAKMSPSDVEALLAHELAHVRRHDYLVNLVQTVIETVLFYHPCVWWISRIVRTEREHCCDDIAVSVLGDRNRYATALVDLEQLRHDTPRLVMAANHGPLISRIRRVLLMPQRSVVPASFWLTLFIVCSIAAGLGFSQTKLPSPHKPSPVEVIAGQVVDAGGKAVAGATVLWQDNMIPSNGFHVRVVKTDARGAYRFDDAPPEPGILLAFRRKVGFGVLPPFGDSRRVIRLQPTRAVPVRVVDTAGRPVPAIRVGPSVLIFDDIAYGVSPEALDWLGATTDADGRATLEDMPEYCSAKLDVQDDRFTSQLHDAVSELTYTRANKVVISAACTVVGVVTMDGKPVVRAAVSAVPVGQWNPTGNAATDAHGQFELRRQPKCNLNLSCFLPEALTGEWIVRPTTVVTDPKLIAHVIFRLQRGVEITGIVVDKEGRPAPRISVAFRRPNAARGIEAAKMTGPDGTFKAAIPPGTHEVELFGGRGIQSESTLTVRDGESRFLRLTAPPKPAEAPTMTCTCLAIDADGRARGGIEVQCRYQNAAGREEDQYRRTNSKGEALFELTPRQAATVSFKASSGNQFSDGLISAVGGKATVRLRRVTLGSVSGTVLDPNGRPISGATLDLGISSHQPFVGDIGEMNWTNNIAGPRGSFKFPSIYPGTPVVVMAHAEGFADAQSSVYRVVGGRDIKIPPIRLQPGQVISGRVVDWEGHPVVGAGVWVDKIFKVSNTVVHSESDGTFRYTRVPAGKHTLWISQKGHAESFPITKEEGVTYKLSQ